MRRGAHCKLPVRAHDPARAPEAPGGEVGHAVAVEVPARRGGEVHAVARQLAEAGVEDRAGAARYQDGRAALGLAVGKVWLAAQEKRHQFPLVVLILAIFW